MAPHDRGPDHAQPQVVAQLGRLDIQVVGDLHGLAQETDGDHEHVAAGGNRAELAKTVANARLQPRLRRRPAAALIDELPLRNAGPRRDKPARLFELLLIGAVARHGHREAVGRVDNLGGRAALGRNRLARSLKARIAQIEETLHQQQVAEKPEVSTDMNQAMMGLAAELTRARFDLIGYKERAKELTSTIARLQQDIKSLERASFTHEAMVRQLQLAQSNYLLYAKKQEEARISEALDREKFANVSIIDPASVPLDPVRPNRQLNLVMGFFLALFVGVGTAWGVSFFDDVVHSRDDVERHVNVPVIVSIPEGHWPPNLLPENMLEPGNFSAHSS